MFEYVRLKREESLAGRACIAIALRAASVPPATLRLGINVRESLENDAVDIGVSWVLGVAPELLSRNDRHLLDDDVSCSIGIEELTLDESRLMIVDETMRYGFL